MIFRLKRFAGFVISLLSSLVPKNRHLIALCSKNGYGGNARAFYEGMVAKSTPYRIVWISYDERSDHSYEGFGIPHRRLRSLGGVWTILRARWLVSTHGEMAKTRAFFGQRYLNLWHGLPFKVSGYLWDPADGDSYAADVSRSDYMAVTSPLTSVLMAAIFHIKAHKVVPVGYPRNQRLLDRQTSRQKLEEFVGETYDQYWLYCPTHRHAPGQKHDVVESSWTFEDFLERYLDDALNEHLEHINGLLLIKLHPFEEKKYAHLGARLPSRVRKLTTHELSTTETGLYEILGGFDMLWTDYSSISHDFLLTDRPMLYFVDDLDQYCANRGVVLDNYEFLTPGPRVKSIEECLEALARYADSPSYCAEERAKLKGLIHTAPSPFIDNICALLDKG